MPCGIKINRSGFSGPVFMLTAVCDAFVAGWRNNSDINTENKDIVLCMILWFNR